MTQKLFNAAVFALYCLEDIFGKEKVDVTAINLLREGIRDYEESAPGAALDHALMVSEEIDRRSRSQQISSTPGYWE